MTRTQPFELHWRTAALIGSLTIVAFLASSCFKADVGIQINDDGSGSVSVLVAVDQDQFDKISQSFSDSSATPTPKPAKSTGNEIFDTLDKSTLPAGAKAEAYAEGKFKGARITAPFKAGDDIDALIEKLGSSTNTPGTDSSGGGSKVFEKFSLQKDGANWVFDATVPAPQGSSDSSDLFTADQAKLLFKDASFTVRLKLPGHVTSDNADKHDNGELTWNLDLFAKDGRSLTARSEPGGGGSDFPILPVAGGAALLVIVIAAIVVVMSRRGGAPPASTVAGASAPPAAPFGAAPPANPTPPEPPAPPASD